MSEYRTDPCYNRKCINCRACEDDVPEERDEREFEDHTDYDLMRKDKLQEDYLT